MYAVLTLDKNMETVDCYTDGSFDGKYAKWAYLLVENNAIIHQDSGLIIDPIINDIWNIAGECYALMQAVAFAKENKIRLKVYYDYSGLRAWLADFFGEKPWQTKKPFTKYYRDYMLEYKNFIYDLIKVKGHSGNFFNDKADELAGNAVNINNIEIPAKYFTR